MISVIDLIDDLVDIARMHGVWGAVADPAGRFGGGGMV